MADPIKTWPHDPIERDKTVREEGEGHGWIQWKGTDVCVDVHCKCGTHGHFDGMFLYFYKCPGCKDVFAVGQVVRLYPLTPELLAAHADSAKVGEDNSR